MKKLPDLSLEELQIDIYQYIDYKGLLADYVEACQQAIKKYSFRYFSQRLGIQSSGYMQMLIQGKRQVSEDVLSELIQLLGVRGEQRVYLELLVRRQDVEQQLPLYDEYMHRLKDMRSKPQRPVLLKESQARCVSSWLHWVIREMTFLKGASLNVQWFKKCLSPYISVSPVEISRCLEDLKEAGLLVEQDHQVYAPEPSLDFERNPKIAKLLKLYQEEAILQSVQGLKVPASQRAYNNLLITTTPEQLEELKEKLSSLPHEALKTLEASEEASSVLVSFSFQLFPVAKLPEEH